MYIRKAYFGGGVDVYKPKPENLYYYHVNSLYPSMMLNDMPVGKPVYKRYKQNHILQHDDFGFFNANIEYYGDLKAPILPYKQNGVSIFPTGKWQRVYFSEQLKKAASSGYKIQIKNGWVFKRKKIFNNFVNELYSLRIKTNDNCVNLIMKLILNSLYGRFGMMKTVQECKIVTSQQYKKIEIYHNIVKVHKLADDKYMVSYNNNLAHDIKYRKIDFSHDEYYSKKKAINIKLNTMNVAVQIAAAIT